MTNANESAFPEVQPLPQFDYHTYGLTKREYFAAMATDCDIEAWTKEIREALAGYEQPSFSKDPLKYIQFVCDAESKLRRMKADALIAELNRENKI